MALTTILPSGLNSANDFSSLVPSAYATANSAASFANGAFTAANTADGKATSAGSFANGAFVSANSSSLYANAAFIQANSAFGQSNNQVWPQANAAFSAANSASSYANSAFTKANNALANTSGATFQGQLNITGTLRALTQGGDEGGEIFLDKAATNTTLSAGVTIDIFQNKLRFFETGGSVRGAYIDISAAGAGVGSDLLSGGGGGTTDTTARASAAAAFDKANSANTLAQSGFIQANAAFLQANAVSTQSNNQVWPQANAAFSAANSASLYANGAFAAANAGSSDSWARAQANAAFITANSASTYANVPYISSGTSNVSMTTSGGNIYMNVGGVNIVNVSTTWANVTGNIAATQGVYSAVVNTTSIYATSNIITANIRTTGSAGNISGANYVTSNFFIGEGSALTNLKPNTHMTIALSDETTSITTGTAKITFRAPFAMTLTQIPRASLTVVSSSGIPEVDINKNGVSIFSTRLTIDANEKTSTTAATAAVLSTTTFADDDEITMDVDVAGTGAKGLKVTLYYRRT